MKVCPRCGHENGDHTNYCTHCGMNLQNVRPTQMRHRTSGLTCPNCGASLKPGQKFCTHCGRPVADVVFNNSADETVPIDGIGAYTEPDKSLQEEVEERMTDDSRRSLQDVVNETLEADPTYHGDDDFDETVPIDRPQSDQTAVTDEDYDETVPLDRETIAAMEQNTKDSRPSLESVISNIDEDDTKDQPSLKSVIDQVNEEHDDTADVSDTLNKTQTTEGKFEKTAEESGETRQQAEEPSSAELAEAEETDDLTEETVSDDQTIKTEETDQSAEKSVAENQPEATEAKQENKTDTLAINVCPRCGAKRLGNFCVSCGYDFRQLEKDLMNHVEPAANNEKVKTENLNSLSIPINDSVSQVMNKIDHFGSLNIASLILQAAGAIMLIAVLIFVLAYNKANSYAFGSAYSIYKSGHFLYEIGLWGNIAALVFAILAVVKKKNNTTYIMLGVIAFALIMSFVTSSLFGGHLLEVAQEAYESGESGITVKGVLYVAAGIADFVYGFYTYSFMKLFTKNSDQ